VAHEDQHWMEKMHKGHLHRLLGVAEGTPIPQDKMRAALSGKYGEAGVKMAHAAVNMEHESGHTSHLPG
jgi:hypothetical protein